MTEDGDRDDDVETLRARLAEAHETLRAIRHGEVDALIVQTGGGDQLYTLHTTDEPYRHLVEQMQEGAAVLAASGDVLYCNARFAALVGTPLGSVIGSHLDRFVDPSARDGLQAMLTAGSGKGRSRLIDSVGRGVDIYLSVTSTVSNNVNRLNLVATDLREITDALFQLENAERASRLKDEFLAMLAHELRNPIAALQYAVEVIESPESQGDRVASAGGVIARQVTHLARLIDELVEVDRVISGRIVLDRRPLDMARAVSEAAGCIAARVTDRHIEITAEPTWIDGDAVRIEQVVTNLLTNAVEFTPTGGRIRVALRGDGNDALLIVEDTGVGMSAELLPLVFGVFVQGDRTLARKGGLGIGLPLVRRLVEQHGGTVEASSDGAGHGSRFTVRVPRIPAPEPIAVVAPPPDPVIPRRVLLIEDNADAREMLRLLLSLNGHVVHDAADGVRGLQLLEEHPDVAVIDIGLPGLDGYQVARRIREHPNGRAMLLVALTGYGLPSDHRKALEAGFDHHLVKPVDADDLARLLNTSGQPGS